MDIKEIVLSFFGGFGYGIYEGNKEYKLLKKESISLRRYKMVQCGFKNGFNCFTFITLFQLFNSFQFFSIKEMNHILSGSITGGICGSLLKSPIRGMIYGSGLGFLYSFKRKEDLNEIKELKELFEINKMNETIDKYVKDEEYIMNEIEKFLKK